MPFSSAGVFTRLYDWLLDQQRNVKVIGSRLNDEFDGVGTALAAIFGRTREKLTANRSYYVRGSTSTNTGNDANTGLVDNAAGAFLTIQRAIDVVKTLDLNGKIVSIFVADGAYTGTVVADGAWIGEGSVQLVGNTTTPANVTLTVTGAAITVQNHAVLVVAGFKITSTNGNALQALFRGELYFFSVVLAGTAGIPGLTAIYASRFGYVEALNDWSVTGDVSGNLIQASHGGQFRTSAGTCTIGGTGTRLFTTLVYCDGLSEIVFSGTSAFAVTAAGVVAEKYREEGGGYMQANGYRSPEPNFEAFFPGDVGGQRRTVDGAIIHKVISPAQITSNQNDYSPQDATYATSYTSAGILRLTSDANYDITGIAPAQVISTQVYSVAHGQQICLSNIGAFVFTLKTLSGSSAVGAKFSFSADVVLAALDSKTIWYDSANGLWRPVS